MNKSDPRLYGSHIGFIWPFEKRVTERKLKVAPYVHIETIRSGDKSEDIKYFIINSYNKTIQPVSYKNLNLLNNFSSWSVFESLDYEDDGDEIQILLYYYNSGMFSTEIHELAYELLSEQLFNYTRKREEKFTVYYLQKEDFAFYDVLEEKILSAIGFLQSNNLFLDRKPFIIFCHSEEQMENIIELNYSIDYLRNTTVIPALHKYGLVLNVKNLDLKVIKSDDFYRNLIIHVIFAALYDTGTKLPFWFEHGFAHALADLVYDDKDDEPIGDILYIEDYDFIFKNLIYNNEYNNVVKKKLIAVSKNIIKELIATHGMEKIFQLIHEMKYFNKTFKQTFESIFNFTFESYFNQWNEKNKLSLKKFSIQKYEVIKKKYFDKNLYFFKNESGATIEVDEMEVKVAELLLTYGSFHTLISENSSILPYFVSQLAYKMLKLNLIDY